MRKPLNFIHISKNGGTTIGEPNNWSYKNKQELFANRSDSPGLNGPVWHQPPRCFKKAYREKFTWFAVIRDPLERCLSEAHCNWDGFGQKSILPIPTLQEFNEYICKRIKNRMTTGHWHPQFHYLFDEQGESYVDYIVRFDSLVSDYNLLARAYGTHILESTDRRNSRKRHLYSASELYDETLSLIETSYALDFTLYRQSIRHPGVLSLS